MINLIADFVKLAWILILIQFFYNVMWTLALPTPFADSYQNRGKDLCDDLIKLFIIYFFGKTEGITHVQRKHYKIVTGMICFE